MLKQAASRSDQITLTNLPQWSRINNLDRARYPKPFMKDRLQPLPQTVPDAVGPAEASCSEQPTMTETTPGITDSAVLQKKVQQLENTVTFLRKQHRDVLEALHEEVDTLKRRNHELQFQIAMCQAPTADVPVDSVETVGENLTGPRDADNKASINYAETRNSVNDGKTDTSEPANHNEIMENTTKRDINKKLEKLEITFKQEEVEEVKNLLKEEKQLNARLREELEKERASETHDTGTEGLVKLVPHPPLKPKSSDQPPPRTRPMPASFPFSASIEPLQIHVNPHHSRPPTLQECETIIRHLTDQNSKQTQELSKMKSDLRDVLYTHKWTPDSYLLAKSYLPDDETYESSNEPRDNQRQSLKQLKRPPALVSMPREGVFLPPLIQPASYRLAERRVPKLLPRRRIASEQPLGINMTRDGIQ